MPSSAGAAGWPGRGPDRERAIHPRLSEPSSLPGRRSPAAGACTSVSSHRVEHHPAGDPWRERFPDARTIALFEGGEVHASDAEGGFWLIKDEGTLADLLDPEEDADLLARLVSLERYPTAQARDQAAATLSGAPAGRVGAPSPPAQADHEELVARALRLYEAAAQLAARSLCCPGARARPGKGR